MTGQIDQNELPSPELWRSLLGTKVSLRYRIHDDSEHPFSEAVGLVQSVAPDDHGVLILTVVNRHGRESHMALADILAAKTF